MASRDILQCVPKIQSIFPVFKHKVNKCGLDIIITCTARTYQEQVALYSQGRETLDIVNNLRHTSGLAPIQQKQNVVVTWTLDSKHVVGKARTLSEAVDIALVYNGKPHWNLKADVNNDQINDYLQVAQIAKECGFTPGAFFKKSDFPHLEV